MLRYAVIFLVVALIAGVLGFSAIATGTVEMARIIFVIFIMFFVVALLSNLPRGKTPPL